MKKLVKLYESEISGNDKVINLLETTSKENLKRYRKEFGEFKEKTKNPVVDVNKEFNLKTGDIIEFKNGYDIPMSTEILGFDSSDGEAYLLWDCYWFTLNLKKRFVKKLK